MLPLIQLILSCLAAFADSGIKSPEDFIGRKIELSGGYDEVQFSAMMKNLEIDTSEMEILPYSYDYHNFLNGETDVTVSFAAGSLLTLKKEIGDREIVKIWPEDYGVHFYSDTIVSTDEFISNNPDLVLRFLLATLKGHNYAIENPDEAVAATMKYAEVQDPEVQLEMLEASIPLMHTGQNPIGWMESERWEAMYHILIDQKEIKESFDLSSAYTMEFINNIYGK